MGLLSGAVAGLALDQAIPLNRVWSFPKEIVVPEVALSGNNFLSVDWIIEEFRKRYPVGSTIRLRMPQQWVLENGVTVGHGWLLRN
jgi:hypothetical protein